MGKQVELYDCFPLYGYENSTLIAKEQGCITVPIKIVLPEVHTLEDADYNILNELSSNIISTLGENKLIHIQHFFFEEHYEPLVSKLGGDFLEQANEAHFQDRPFFDVSSYMYISHVPKKYMHFNSKRVNKHLTKKRAHYLSKVLPSDYLDANAIQDFKDTCEGVCTLINASGLISAEIMDYDSIFKEGGLYEKALTLDHKSTSLKDIDFSNNTMCIGGKKAQFFTFENLDQFDKEYMFNNEYSAKLSSPGNLMPVSNLFSLGFDIPYEHIINQYIYIPEADHVFKKLRKKAKRFTQFSGKTEDDANRIYANQIYEFNKEVIENHKQIVFYHLNVEGIVSKTEAYKKMCNAVNTAFKKLRIQVKENTIDRKNLFQASLPGNAIGLATELYMPMSSDMAASLSYYEGNYKESSLAVDGIRLVDRIKGRPLNVSVYKEPEKRAWIFNRGMLVASGSGGGKSYLVNHYLASELRLGSEIIIMEDGNSYDKLVSMYGGVILEHDDESPFTFNPFLLDKYDTIIKAGNNKLSEDKLMRLVSLISLLAGGADRNEISVNKEVRKTVIEMLITSYYRDMWRRKDANFKFDSFYVFAKQSLSDLLEEKSVPNSYFNPEVFLFLLEKYFKGGAREHLLNKEDKRITHLSEQKIIYFKLRGLIDNELLFPILSLMIMELFNKKLMDKTKRHINKIMVSDEAWKVLVKPELEDYFNAQSRTARKEGGQPIFVSQKVDDFTASAIIKNAIVVNSHIKVFLDMKDFIDSFEQIQETMGLTDKQKIQILSLNKNLPKDRKLREVAICWKDKVKVYGIETSLEEKCIYETNPIETHKINRLYEKNNKNWELTAKSYANK